MILSKAKEPEMTPIRLLQSMDFFADGWTQPELDKIDEALKALRAGKIS